MSNLLKLFLEKPKLKKMWPWFKNTDNQIKATNLEALGPAKDTKYFFGYLTLNKQARDYYINLHARLVSMQTYAKEVLNIPRDNEILVDILKLIDQKLSQTDESICSLYKKKIAIKKHQEQL